MADVNSTIFNKRAAEKLRSPDDLDKFVRVTNPSVWVVLAACVALLAGLLAWGVFGAVTSSVSTTGVAINGKAMCFLDAEDAALYFSRLPIPCRRDGEPDLSSGLYWRHLGIYAYRGAFLKKFVAAPPCLLEKTESLEQLRALNMGAKILVLRTVDTGVGVDTPADVPRMEALLRAQGKA